MLGAGDGAPPLYHVPRACGEFLAGQGKPNLGDASLATPSPHRAVAGASPLKPLRLELPPQDTLDQTQVVESQVVETPSNGNEEARRTGSVETIPDTPAPEYWPDNQLGLEDSQRGGHTPVSTPLSEPGDKSSPQQQTVDGSTPASPAETSKPISSEKTSQAPPTGDNTKEPTNSSGSKPEANTRALQKAERKAEGSKAVAKPTYKGGFYWKILARTNRNNAQCRSILFNSNIIDVHAYVLIYKRLGCEDTLTRTRRRESKRAQKL